MKRRELLLTGAATGLVMASATTTLAQMASTMASTSMASTAAPTTHVVQMLNTDPDNKRDRMVFKPAVVFANPGDTIVFEPTDKGHNSETMDDMLPEGADGWKGIINKEVSVTLTQEGVYGYKCTPHASMGMMGLVVVGNPVNLDTAKAVRIRGRQAQERMEAYFAQVESAQ